MLFYGFQFAQKLTGISQKQEHRPPFSVDALLVTVKKEVIF